MRYSILLVSFVFCLLSCGKETAPNYLQVGGKTMGTYYKVTYLDTLQRDFSKQIDSLLVAVNAEISTYESEATITKLNRSNAPIPLDLNFKVYSKCVETPKRCGIVQNRHFYENWRAAKVVHRRTDGAFDPTVMSLVNYWGFGYTPQQPVTAVDSLKVDSLRALVGFDKMELKDENGYAVIEKSPGMQLDFGGTGQGYGIDAVSEYLEIFGVKNYLVDIGGECRARGKNPYGEWWSIGLNTPDPNASVNDFTRMLQLENLSVSTSGNYRKFHEVDGKKYSHFINPVTGFPEKSTLLSASVFGKNCLLPDAYATGFMVMGLDKAYALADQMEDIEALFIYSDENGEYQVKYTPGVAKFLMSEGVEE